MGVDKHYSKREIVSEPFVGQFDVIEKTMIEAQNQPLPAYTYGQNRRKNTYNTLTTSGPRQKPYHNNYGYLPSATTMQPAPDRYGGSKNNSVLPTPVSLGSMASLPLETSPATPILGPTPASAPSTVPVPLSGTFDPFKTATASPPLFSSSGLLGLMNNAPPLTTGSIWGSSGTRMASDAAVWG